MRDSHVGRRATEATDGRDAQGGTAPRPWQRRLAEFLALKPVTAFFRRFVTLVDRPLLRLTKGRRSATAVIAGLPTVNVTTVGAKSGLPRTVPLVAIGEGDCLAVVATNFGRAHYPAWYYNLRANPQATVTADGRTSTYLAEEVSGAARERLWQRFVALYPGYARYAERAAHRDIPILLLRPKED